VARYVTHQTRSRTSLRSRPLPDHRHQPQTAGSLACSPWAKAWHNNPSHFDASARQCFYWFGVNLDITYYTLKILSWFGIVWDSAQSPDAFVTQDDSPPIHHQSHLIYKYCNLVLHRSEPARSEYCDKRHLLPRYTFAHVSPYVCVRSIWFFMLHPFCAFYLGRSFQRSEAAQMPHTYDIPVKLAPDFGAANFALCSTTAYLAEIAQGKAMKPSEFQVEAGAGRVQKQAGVARSQCGRADGEYRGLSTRGVSAGRSGGRHRLKLNDTHALRAILHPSGLADRARCTLSYAWMVC